MVMMIADGGEGALVDDAGWKMRMGMGMGCEGASEK